MRRDSKVTGILLVGLIFVGCGQKPIGDSQTLETETSNYIVVLSQEGIEQKSESLRQSLEGHHMVKTIADDLITKHQLKPANKLFSSSLRGGVFELNSDQARNLALDSRVLLVEKEQIYRINTTQSQPTWGLDRIDQVQLPLNGSYSFDDSGVPVNVYVIDTGIKGSHQEFAGRYMGGTDIVDNDSDPTDCNGHGTHVAGTIGGTQFGVNKKAHLFAVRVLNCDGSGTTSDVVSGIEWVTAHHQSPAVANMSLGGGASRAIDNAINAATQAGVTFVVAAGNENTNACGGSPSRVPAAITVGATNSSDSRSDFSNYGSCVDIFAPGEDITSAWYNSNSATHTISGTSMASPHVAGAASLYISLHPNASPSEVRDALTNGGSQGQITDAGSGSPNILLNISSLSNGGGNTGDDGNSGSSELVDGQTMAGLTDIKGGEKVFTFNVSENTSTLTIEMSGGSGDPDLYVRSKVKPSSTLYDCRPYKSGSTESCIFNSPSPGLWFIVIRGYTDYSGVNLKLQTKAKDVKNPCEGCESFQGSLKNKGDSAYVPVDEFTSKSGNIKIVLEGPAQTDFDLYLYKKSGSSWNQVARSITTSSSEKIEYQATAGVYRIKVLGYSGSGDFTLWRKLP